MYFVDIKTLNLKLEYLEQLTQDFETEKNSKYALERIAHMMIESVVDIGNLIIDAFILRDPGNYKDVIDIMELEKVFQPTTAEEIRNSIDFRKELTRNYESINHDELRKGFEKAVPFYKQSIVDTKHFLENENVAVTAFGEGDKNERL
ncbi:hypothetical protein AXY37_12235 [Mammaliicoccus lentus]|uniref:DUF86 domain-containing protein n=1 Tax=Mammaliicoccus TaxID=2803850 RepID=UPI0007DA2690|nr:MULTISPECIES: DUF86 domain-containing protein [Mammaliicoccus]MBF0794516.1 DUF86 domain-containing protein [Mammaliicoccus lentus]MCD2478950.1 DUF86 domain-containing protein [Mammaliicoccus lentus]MCD2520355.1 DUF86 domain-containing protein [Mammaliicoccus lentus]MCR1873618.1 DUF86 domain-containing protein [Mammaliicoccus lentus]MEB5687218.1 DUF86 domain-containing protein [Mammaliicoccus lentus]